MKYSEIYRNQALTGTLPQVRQSGKVGWRSPSNIALVKYWGKRSPQIPMNPSISFTLKNAYTETIIDYLYNPDMEGPAISYNFEGKQNPAFTERIRNYLDDIREYMPVLKRLNLNISSFNSFPHSAGIASSASAFAALALCLFDIELRITGETMEEKDFYRRASFLARMGSGSASRSVYGGIVLWGEIAGINNSSDEYAIGLSDGVHSVFTTYQDTILILNDQQKKVSSSVGHALMENNPFSEVRFLQAREHVSELQNILALGNVKAFIRILELEAFTLHAMMMTSEPAYFLMNTDTLEVISRIRQFREETKIPIGFTLDAGPNIHLLYPKKYQKKVNDFIRDELIQFCIEGRLINDCVGEGPTRL